MFPKETLSVMAGCDIPEDDVFRAELLKSCNFRLSAEEWKAIKPHKVPSGGRALTTPWTEIFAFTYNGVKCQNSQKRKHPFFLGKASCKHSECNDTVVLTISSTNVGERLVEATFCGSVSHIVGEIKARHVKQTKRTDIMDDLRGKTPSHLYNSKLASMNPEMFLSGNRDETGSINVLRAISSEEKQADREDDDIFFSLRVLKRKLKEEDESAAKKVGEGHFKKRKMLGYLRYICQDPLVLMMWTEAGVRLWHDIAPQATCYWDATGTLVRRENSDDPQIQPITVAEMITNSHGKTTITNFLAEFRNAEAKIFGFSNVAIPLRMESDMSFPLILKEVNGEVFQEFLERA